MAAAAGGVGASGAAYRAPLGVPFFQVGFDEVLLRLPGAVLGGGGIGVGAPGGDFLQMLAAAGMAPFGASVGPDGVAGFPGALGGMGSITQQMQLMTTLLAQQQQLMTTLLAQQQRSGAR
jgi:hypothetical protein